MSLTYQDCKELKDAGFPQGNGFAIVPNGTLFEVRATDLYSDDMAYRPTLSELIEACGDKFRSLNKQSDNETWTACTENDFELGSSPEQAVKNLWIALQSKTNK